MIRSMILLSVQYQAHRAGEKFVDTPGRKDGPLIWCLILFFGSAACLICGLFCFFTISQILRVIVLSVFCPLANCSSDMDISGSVIQALLACLPTVGIYNQARKKFNPMGSSLCCTNFPASRITCSTRGTQIGKSERRTAVIQIDPVSKSIFIG